MSTHLTRKELKQDNVALHVGETFDFLSSHRQQTVRIAVAVLAVAAIAGGIWYYLSSQHEVRQQMLGEAIAAQNAQVGPPPPSGALSYPTDAAKRDAVAKAYTKLLTEKSGSEEGYVAEYALASTDVENNKLAEARKKLQDVADHANTNYASLAKLALAQVDFSENKLSDARNLLKDLQDHPTDLVSKDQATFALAKGLAPTSPDEARKLLTPLAAGASDLAQTASAALGELPQK